MLLNAVVGGWELSGVGTMRSGLPLNVTISRPATTLPDQINSNQRPNLVPGVSIYPSHRTTTELAQSRMPSRCPPMDVGQCRNGHRARARSLADGYGPAKTNARVGTASDYLPRGSIQCAQCRSIRNSGVKMSTSGLNLVPGTFGLINSAFNTNPTGSGTPRQLELSLRTDF